MSGLVTWVDVVPEHVAAYALGLRHGSGGKISWEALSRFIRAMGLGWYPAGELRAAARAWGNMHVAAGVVALLARLPPRARSPRR